MLNIRNQPTRLALGLLMAFAVHARADFSYQQTYRMTGGSMLKFLSMIGGRVTQPVTATVSIKGDKMAWTTPHAATVIDLEAKTVTKLDLDRKTYGVLTFDDLKSAMEAVSGPDGVTITDFRVDMKEGLKSKNVLGKETHENVVTVLMTGTDTSGKSLTTRMTGDIYAFADIEGIKEFKEFYKRMGSVEWSPGLQGLNNPEMNKALAGMFVRMRQIDGLPLLSVMTVSGAIPGIPSEMSNLQDSSPGDQPSGGILSGKLAGLAAAMKRRSENGDANDSNAGPLLELTSEVSTYSTKAVNSSVFQIPDGFSRTDAATQTRER